MRLRVVTFKVWNIDGDARRPELINDELKRLDPDLIAFQEVVQTRELKMLYQLLDGLDRHATYQADFQRYIPPFAQHNGRSVFATGRCDGTSEEADQTKR